MCDRKADGYLAIILLAGLSAVLPGYAHRMGALLGQAGVVDDPGYNRAAFRHRRQRIVARAAQQGLVAPGSVGHHMVQRLMHTPDVGRGQTRCHRLDRLALPGQQQPGAVQLQGNSTIRVPGGFRQTVKIVRQALLPGA
jgi:hypothetical protein